MRDIYHPNAVKNGEINAISKGDQATLMITRAATAILEYINETPEIDTSSVLILAGKGNNGADGILLGKMLLELGCDVSFYKSNASQISKENAYFSHGVSFLNTPPTDFRPFTLIIDALFGIGFHGSMKEEDKELVIAVNNSKKTILSIDIPSGVNSANGSFEVAVKADYTCALNCYKPGHFLFPGAEQCGKITLLQVNIPLIDQPFMRALEETDLQKLPKRPIRSNKGTFGKIAIVAGSFGMAGAAYFAAKAALLSGCGLVKIYTHKENRIILQTILPEAILSCYDEETNLTDLSREIALFDAMVLGPGLGMSDLSKALATSLLSNLSIPAVVDADGLNLCVGTNLLQNYKGSLIITPHPGEAARLLGCSVDKITENILENALTLSKKYACTALLKDAHTVIASQNEVYVNLSGNNGMATAGSGDILTGIIASLLAVGISPFQSGAYGAFIHGCAGDCSSKKHGTRSTTASRILDHIEEVFSFISH